MIVGEQSKLAIESGITEAYESLGFRALGFFVIYIKNQRFGVHKPDATYLACSWDEVQERIFRRGRHVVAFATEPDAVKIAAAFRNGVYSLDHENEHFFGIPQANFSKLFYSSDLVWAPDGDEAFDDGSYVLQFDLENTVRLIGFKTNDDGSPDLNTLRDLYLGADEFYGILEKWRDNFDADWKMQPKVSDGNT